MRDSWRRLPYIRAAGQARVVTLAADIRNDPADIPAWLHQVGPAAAHRSWR